MRTRIRTSWCLGLVGAGFAVACSSDGNSTDTTPYTRDKLLDPQTCNECHQDHYKEWSGSMHAYASTDPIFRAMNARGQKETNGALGDFCVKCHAPMAVNENAVTDFADISMVPQKLQGITCYFCHNVTDVTDTHNNPLKLANDVTMRGGILDPLKYKGHTAEYSKFYDENISRAGLQSSNLCGSCHDIVVPAHFSGAKQDVALERTFSEWQGSIFADALHPNGLNCASDCHMKPLAQVPIASPRGPHPTMPTRVARHQHDFPAIDTALVADFPEASDAGQKEAQLAAIQEKLGTEFRIQVCADPFGLGGGIIITLENLSAGHNFPSGASQDRRLWAEIHAYQKDLEAFSSGVVPPGTAATSVPDATACRTACATDADCGACGGEQACTAGFCRPWVLYDQAFKADGTPAHMFWDIASITTQTIPTSTAANVLTNGNTAVKQFRVPPLSTGKVARLDRVTVTLWVEPMGLEVLDDMVMSGFLDASVRDAMPRYRVQLVDGPDSGTPITYEWTLDKAMNGPDRSSMNNLLCTENTLPRFAPPPPTQ